MPARQYLDVIKRHHDLLPAGHWGIARTSALIRRKHLTPNLKRRVQAFVSTCDICQRFKSEHHLPRGHVEMMDLPQQKWQSVSMDWISLPAVVASGHQYDEVLTVTDRATKMVHLIPTSSTTATVETATLFFEHVVRHHGLPSSIVSDRDPIFTSEVWSHLCDQLQIKQCCTAPFHPQANGQAERTNQTMKQVLQALLASRPHYQWLTVLYMVEMAINNAPIASTEFSPYYLNYGFHPVFQWDVPATETELPISQRSEPFQQF